MAPSQLLLTVVEKNKEVKVYGNLPLHVYASALSCIEPGSSEALIAGSQPRLAIAGEAPLILTISPNPILLSREAS